MGRERNASTKESLLQGEQEQQQSLITIRGWTLYLNWTENKKV